MPITLTRSLLVILLPGFVALAPWAFWFASKVPKFDQIYKTYDILANAMLVGLAILIGCIIEIIVTHFEARWDKQRDSEFSVHANWYDYLASHPPEPIGFRYISRRATTLYFELAMVIASPFALTGLAAAYYENFNSALYPQ
ncbi:MAG: hypothetical protein JWN13_4390 [Betaproteobacteria bacterium]|jgi:hypothetical protein|nr:hypothetical protein [Betaproteobacteria bacterium]